MATWITHLRLAEALFPLISGLDEALFAIGNIAPDSGLPDENWENFDPPGEVTHFKPAGGLPFRCADLAFYRRYLQPVGLRDDPQRYSFLLGYFFHLVTDNLWSQQIGQPTKARYAAEFVADPDMWSQIKRDWYGEDFDYVRRHPESLFWRVFLNSEYIANYLDFLSTAAIQRNIEYIQTLYRRTDDEIEQWYIRHPGIYLTGEAMDGFVARNTLRLCEIYRQITAGRGDHNGASSILEIADSV